MARRYPVFLCEPNTRKGITMLSFWCPYCAAKHTHGAPPGHRVAHCHSPEGMAAFPQGYIIKVDPEHQATCDKIAAKQEAHRTDGSRNKELSR